MSEKKYYRPDELAQELGKHVETIRRWIREHRIIHVHDPGGTRISHDEYLYVLMHGVRARGSCHHGPSPRPM
jgi:excisionase family DNA binding protein